MRNIIVEVFSLNPEELTYRPVHGDGQFYDDYTGYEIRELKESNINYREFIIRDRRNADIIKLHGYNAISGERRWNWETESGYNDLPFDHISVYEVLNDNTKVYL